MAIKVKRTTRDVAGWRKLSSAQRAKLEQEYLNTPEGREFSKRNPLRAGNKVAWQYKLDEAVNRYYDRGGQAYTQGSKALQARASSKSASSNKGTQQAVKPSQEYKRQLPNDGSREAAFLASLGMVLPHNNRAKYTSPAQTTRSINTSTGTPRSTVVTPSTRSYKVAPKEPKQATIISQPSRSIGSAASKHTGYGSSGRSALPGPSKYISYGNAPAYHVGYTPNNSIFLGPVTEFNQGYNYNSVGINNEYLQNALRNVKTHDDIKRVLRGAGIDIDSPSGRRMWANIKKLEPKFSGKLLKTIDPKLYAYGNEYKAGYMSPSVQAGTQHMNRPSGMTFNAGGNALKGSYYGFDSKTPVPYRPGAEPKALPAGTPPEVNVTKPGLNRTITGALKGSALGTAASLGYGLTQGQLMRIALETGQHIYDDPYLNGGQRDHNGVWHNNYGDQNTAKLWNYRYEDDNGNTYTDFGNILKNGHLIQAPNGELQYYMGDPKQFDMPGEVGFERSMKARMAKRPLTPHQAREIWDSPYKKYIPEHLIPSIIRLKDRDGGTTEVDRGQLPDVIVNAPGPRKSTPRPAPQRPTPVQQQPERTPMIPIGPGQIGPIADLEPNKNPLYNPNLGDAGIGNLPARDIDGNVPMPPMVRPTIPYLGGGIPAMREALSYYPEDYNPLIHRFDDLMFR